MAGQNNGKQGGQQQDVNQLLKVRREKLANLQEAGQDPFQITKYDVTHHTSDVRIFTMHTKRNSWQADRQSVPMVWTRQLQERQSKQIMRREEASWMPIRSTYPLQDA